MRQDSDMFGGWRARGLRLRYRPSSRITQGVLSFVPWVDILLVGLFFVLVGGQLTLSPGLPVNLPDMPFQSGVKRGLPLVMVAVEVDEGDSQCLVFFDDVRFRLGDEEAERRLVESIAKKVRADGATVAVLYADAQSPHGMVARLVNLARSAGIRLVNVSATVE